MGRIVILFWQLICFDEKKIKKLFGIFASKMPATK